jgi:hypothetical protein
MKRVSLYFLPALAVIAVLFGSFYVWTGLNVLRQGHLGMAALVTVFGVGGIAMGVALWTISRQFARRRAEVGESGKPS